MNRIFIDKSATIATIENEVFGSFVEHLGRCVYNGIYEKDHPLADERGFRKDVMDIVKELEVPILRYPGGNFISGYDWKDTIGPKRREVIDLAWRALEPNTVGIDEFAYFASKVNSQVLMAVNLGTDTIKSAQEIVEYCNLKDAGFWAKLRKEHGREEPYNIRYWCLGNEMDGPWQIGTKTPEEYGRVALEAGKLMKWVDPSIRLVLCGSSSPTNPTFPEWDRKVLEIAYSQVDYLSLHAYYTYPTDDHNPKEFFASALNFEQYIRSVEATIQYVKTLLRTKKDIYLAMDEYNIWHTFDGSNQVKNDWEIGAPLLENHYDFADAIVLATLLSTLMNHANSIKIACIAQLVNVIAPILTEKGGRVLKQAIYYPFQMISKYFRGKTALHLFKDIESYDTVTYGKAPKIYSTCAYDEKENAYVLLLINVNDMEEQVELSLDHECQLTKEIIYQSDDLHVQNTFDKPFEIVPLEKDIKNDEISLNKTLKLRKNSISLFIIK